MIKFIDPNYANELIALEIDTLMDKGIQIDDVVTLTHEGSTTIFITDPNSGPAHIILSEHARPGDAALVKGLEEYGWGRDLPF